MSNLGRLKPKYISLGITNDTDDLIDASIHQDYGVAAIQKLDNYVVCIERMEINLNGIPFYRHNPTDEGNEVIRFMQRNNADPLLDLEIGTFTLTEDYYNLFDLFEKLNTYLYIISVPGLIFNANYSFNLQFGLDEVGRINISVLYMNPGGFFTAPPANDWQYFYIIFPTYMNMIMGFKRSNFDLANTSGAVGVWGNFATSSYPQLDCGDNLNHIILTSSLPVISDSIDVVQANVLTDVCPVSNYVPNANYPENNNYQLAGSGWSLNTRQKLIYIPTERRYLDLIAPFAMRYIQVDAFYMTNIMTSLKVQLPPGGTFQIKLGFYQK